MNIAKPTPANPKPANSTLRWLRHLPLAATLGALLVFDVLLATVFDVRNDIASGILLGVLFAQVVLLAVWTALGPAKLSFRTIAGFLGTMLIALALVACVARVVPNEAAWVFFAILAVQWMVIQIPFQVCRFFFGWRLSWPDEPITVAEHRGDVQFGIGQLMAWTALVGAALGIGRLLLPEDFGNWTSSRLDSLKVFGVLTVFNSLFAWPITWAMVSPRWWPWWIVPAGVCCWGLTYAEILTFQAVLARPQGAELFWIVNSLQAGASCVPLLAMRVSGFCLIKTRQGPGV